MGSLLKKYFIPSEANEYQPYILRNRALVVILCIALTTELFFLFHLALLFQTNLMATVLPSVILDFTNENRITEGGIPLKTSPLLELAAQQKANDMAQKGYFAHISSEGKTPWYWFDQVGYKYTFAGENLAIHFFDSKDLMQAWMDSPLHRANIINKNYTEMGIGIAQGMYEDKETVFIVQMFGKPAKTIKVQSQDSLPKKQTVILPPSKPELISQNSVKIEEPVKSQEAIQGAETTITQELQVSIPAMSSFEERMVSSPNAIHKYLNISLLLFVIISLLLNIFIYIKIQRPMLILNSTLVLIIIMLVLAFNTALLSNSVII